ncbi:MAG: hypothetical protein ACQETD_09015 [Pseudomonadota bacterium]
MSASEAQSQSSPIHVTIACQIDPGQHLFEVSPQLTVGAFLKRVLNELAAKEGGERVKTLLECYEPALELQEAGAGRALNSGLTLDQAGVNDGALCRIAGTPRKERIMFCRHS